jgi:6-phosphofructokinase 1
MSAAKAKRTSARAAPVRRRQARGLEAIGVLTSGGDAPGMNAAIRAVARSALGHGVAVFGVQRGYEGLMEADLIALNKRSVGNIIQRGGSVLGSSRAPKFRTKAGRQKARRVLEAHGIGGLVVIGGGGTMRGARALVALDGGPVCVAVPATIDNDICGTDRSIGFDTAINTALNALDNIRDTAHTVELLHFIEVMGRDCGWIALMTGVGGGAEAAILPETPTDVEALCHRIDERLSAGKRGVIVVVAEGGFDGGATQLAKEVGAQLKLEYRVNILGHIQRGGRPSASDRVLASQLGVAAVDALLSGRTGVMVGEVDRRIVTTPFDEAIRRRRSLDRDLIRLISLLA